MRTISSLASGWWDYSTLDRAMLDDVARLTPKDLLELARPGFKVRIYDTAEDFHLAEALEYIEAWKQATPGDPAGICGPIGPTRHLPLVARIVNDLELNLRHAHFWSMSEWVVDGKEVGLGHPLGMARAHIQLCFNRMHLDLRMPPENIYFPKADAAAYTASWQRARCAVMQGGQGEAKQWAFNEPAQRSGQYLDHPPTVGEYGKLATRVVALHPATLAQTARRCAGGCLQNVPKQAVTVGPVETWQAEKVSIWHTGSQDTPFGMRLTALMIAKKVADSAVPMSLLAHHSNVQFNYLRSDLGTCEIEIR